MTRSDFSVADEAADGCLTSYRKELLEISKLFQDREKASNHQQVFSPVAVSGLRKFA